MDLAPVARDVIDANLYMTLGTADENGTPWASPVYFVADRYRDFYWASRPGALHSRNLAARPSMSIVIFDSQVPVFQGRAVYIEAVGAQVPEAERDAGLAIYNGPAAARGATIFERTAVEAPAPHRLYRATTVRAYALDGDDERFPVTL